MTQKKSFASAYSQWIEYNNNILELITTISSLLNPTDGASTSTLNLLGAEYVVPNWSFVTNEIERLNSNINSLYGIDSGGALIQTSANVWKKILLNDVNREPNVIAALPIVNRFITKKNNFFDNFVNPSMNVRFDITNSVDADVTSILSRRYIMSFTSNSTQQIFDNLYRGTNIDFDALNTWLNTTSGVSFTYDEEMIDITPASLNLSGNFSVLSIQEDSVNNKLWFVTDSLLYKNKGIDNLLKVGDFIALNRNQSSTLYRVRTISNTDASPKLDLERIQGNESIPVGRGVIKIYNNDTTVSKSIDITVGHNERNVLFLKSINTGKLLSNRWSLGTGFFTNELVLSSNDDNNGKSLDQFYNETVADYGNAIKDLVSLNRPISTGLIPNRPTLVQNNIRVIQINKHLTDSPDRKTLSKKYAAQVAAKTELKSLDAQLKSETDKSAVAGLRSNSRTFNAINRKIENLSKKRLGITQQLTSLNNEILTLTNSPAIANKVAPKYRVRVVVVLPAPRIGGDGKPQEIVQTIYQYKYLTTANTSANIDVLNINGENVFFSDWVTIESPIRKRVADTNGVYKWSADTSGLTRLDIPINRGEVVEVRTKVISEIGFPVIKIESSFSEPFTQTFTQELLGGGNDIDTIISDVSTDIAVNRLKEEVPNIENHLNEQLEIGTETYYHSARKIITSKRDSSGNLLDVDARFESMEREIERLTAIVERSRGKLKVSIFRRDQEFQIIPDQTIPFNIECEDYASKYTQETSLSGRIYENSIYVIKDFYLKIRNASADSPLGLTTNRTYATDRGIYNNTLPQTFWVNERDELIPNNESGITRTQIDNQFLWQINYDSGNVNTTISKISDNISNSFVLNNSNSITGVLSSNEFSIGYSENAILEFTGNNNSLLELNKWVDNTVSLDSTQRLLTTIHPSILNLSDLVENNTTKVKTFQPSHELIVPINIYFKLNSINPSQGDGVDYKYVNFNNQTSTIKHIKSLRFLLEDESSNKPFIFKVRFTINRSKVILNTFSQDVTINDSPRNNFIS